MPVVKLVLAYDGTEFRGFARQPRMRTVQGVIEGALKKVLGEVPKISVAGRTDAGVHAKGQVVSFEAAEEPGRIQRSVNRMLAPEVVVCSATRAPTGFDARHSALSREYLYRIRTAPWPDPFRAPFEWHNPGELDLAAMRKAARLLEGEHDFASFCRRPPDDGSTVRNLRTLSVSEAGPLALIRAEADSFLHQMVRSLAGTLAAVGAGRMSASEVPEALARRDRSAAGPVAPPDGLTLVRVRYRAHPHRRGRSRVSGERE